MATQKKMKIIKTFAPIFASAMLFSTVSTAQNNVNMTKQDSISYSLGVLFAQNFKAQPVELDAALMARGFEAAMKGKEAIKVEMANQIFSQYMQACSSKGSEKAIGEGQKFLDENKKRPNIITTASGLQYEIISAGFGPKPLATDKVTTHYHGTLLDGKVFDSSVQRGEPIEFPVNGVIQGWQEALQLMPKGSKWRLYVPYNLAYGERGAGGSIGPYSTLIFEVELLKINGM
jgi:FKBP-type peptidyl-prolyl cis-trans isomerase FklB